MHDIDYGYRYPAIRAITDLQQMRDQGAVSIAFDRVGYDANDVAESNIYVYVGKCGEHTGWISDDAPYGDPIDAGDKKYILKDAFQHTYADYFYPADQRCEVPESIQEDIGIGPDDTTTKYFGSDLQNAPDGGSSLGGNFQKHNGNNYYGKWRRIDNLGNKDVTAYYAQNDDPGAHYQYQLKEITAYKLNRNGVFRNPTFPETPPDYTGKPVIDRFLSSVDMDHYYDYRFPESKFGPSVERNNSTCVVEVDLEDLFYLSGGKYRNQYQTSADEETANIDFNPRTLQPEISSKDKDKLIYNIFHGKTPIFFMITEKLKCSHYGLANFYFASSKDRKSLKVISSKKQVVDDRLWNAGEVYKTIRVTSADDNDDPIVRIVVDLAQGNEYNPSFENNKRRVWVTTQKGNIKSYDYWTGEQKASARASNYVIKSVAINPKTGDCVFVRVAGNTKNSFLQLCRMKRDSSTVEILANISDYAQDTMENYPMTGGRSASGIAELLEGGVVSKQDKDSRVLWFTFIVNAENTISVQLDGFGSGERKIFWVDRMHYGMWHGANAYGIYKDSNSDKPAIKHAAYDKDTEYGVSVNQNNLRGITTTIAGNVYVNGHSYLHYDDKKFMKYTIIGVHFKNETWEYKGHGGLKSCGAYFDGNYKSGGKYGDGSKYWSYKFDYDTGTWATDADGYAILEKKPLNSYGWPAPNSKGQHYRFKVKNSNSGMTWDVLSKEIGPKLGKDIGGDHWCRMSWAASEFQSKKKSTIKKMQDTVGKFPPLKPGQKTGLVSTGGAFAQDLGKPTFGGSGYGVHMGSTSKSVNVKGGHTGYRPLNVGYIYNAEAYNLRGKSFKEGSKKLPVYCTAASACNFFTASTAISEDDPEEKGNSARPSASEETGKTFYNFCIGQASPPPALPTADFIKQVEARADTSKLYKFNDNFGYVEINSPKYISSKIVPNEAQRTGYCEDAQGFSSANPAHRWYGHTTADSYQKWEVDWDAFSAMPTTITSATNTMFGLEESLPKHGDLTPYTKNEDRYLYQTTNGVTSWTNADTPVSGKLVRLKYGKLTDSGLGILSPAVASGSKAVLNGNSSYITGTKALYVDDTNGLWYEKNGMVYLKTEEEPASAVLKGYKFKGDQITNLGHNKCSSPYFEYTAYMKDVTGMKYGYEQYAGAKRFSIDDKDGETRLVTGVKELSLTTDDTLGNGSRYNDDPVGMRALKALGYCWTKSTKAHPTDVMPSGRLYIMDHYVVEDNACKFMDKIYLDADPSRTETVEISISSIPTSAEFMEWDLTYRYPIFSAGVFDDEHKFCDAGYLITSGKYIECSAASAIVVKTSGDKYKGGKPHDAWIELSDSFRLVPVLESEDDANWMLMYKYPIFSAGIHDDEHKFCDAGYVIKTGTEEACNEKKSSIIAVSGGKYKGLGVSYTIAEIKDSFETLSSFDMSAATVKRPANGLPRTSNSFWDYSTDEGIIISGDSDEAAAVDAYEYLGMLNLPPMYLSDGSTIIGNPVAFRCAGYDKLYTAHLASIYDSGTYEIDHVSIWFNQNPDIDYTKNKQRYEMRDYGPTELSSITIRDKEGTPTFGRETIIARSNRQLNDVLDDSNVVFNHYRDTYCLSADTTWDSVNAYGKPQGIGPLSGAFPDVPVTANLAGWPLSAVYGQTCPRQWYGTEVYRHSNYAGNSEERISLLHPASTHYNKEDQDLPEYISGYGIHPAVYPEESTDLEKITNLSGTWVENAASGINGDAHVVGGSFTTNYYAYVDEREAPSAITVDMGRNYVYVFERWPTQYWHPTCTDSRGGLSLFGDCPNFEDED